MRQRGESNAFDTLEGYRIQSDLDRKLLAGMFERVSNKQARAQKLDRNQGFSQYTLMKGEIHSDVKKAEKSDSLISLTTVKQQPVVSTNPHIAMKTRKK